MQTYILKVPAVGEITREEFRADDSLSQLQTAVGGYIERVPFNFGRGIDCFMEEEGLLHGGEVIVNTRIADIAKLMIVGDAAFAAHDEEGETIGLTAEQCDEIERMLKRRREPEHGAESRNGEAEADAYAVGRESVGHGGCPRILVKNPSRVGD